MFPPPRPLKIGQGTSVHRLRKTGKRDFRFWLRKKWNELHFSRDFHTETLLNCFAMASRKCHLRQSAFRIDFFDADCKLSFSFPAPPPERSGELAHRLINEVTHLVSGHLIVRRSYLFGALSFLFSLSFPFFISLWFFSAFCCCKLRNYA